MMTPSAASAVQDRDRDALVDRNSGKLEGNGNPRQCQRRCVVLSITRGDARPASSAVTY